MWSMEVDCSTKYKSEFHKNRTDLLYELFGDNLHWQNNLTSDAEGEEMLTVSRKRVQEFYAKCKEVTMNPKSYPNYAHESALSRMALLDILFGSKCLPDEEKSEIPILSKEPKPAEPKFKVGDKVIDNETGRKGTVIKCYPNCYVVKRDDAEFPISYIEDALISYTESKEETVKMKPVESKVSVYLATKEEDEEFRRLLHENGFRWNDEREDLD